MWDDQTQSQLTPRERLTQAMLTASQKMNPGDDSPWASLGNAANQIAGAFASKKVNERLQAKAKIKPVQQNIPIIDPKGF